MIETSSREAVEFTLHDPGKANSGKVMSRTNAFVSGLLARRVPSALDVALSNSVATHSLLGLISHLDFVWGLHAESIVPPLSPPRGYYY